MRRGRTATTAVTLAGAVGLLVGTSGTAPALAGPGNNPLGGYKHLVVIYEENHSFDNLFGSWGRAGTQSVRGVNDEGYSTTATQVGQDGSPLACLPQNDVNLTSPPLDAACGNVPLANGSTVASHFGNAPFTINAFIAPEDRTCPPGDVSAPNGVLKDSPRAEPGGCTRDIVHRFYNEQFQLDRGKMDRYSLGSDAMGLTQGRYESTQLPVYQYLHSPGAPKYVLADSFFQGAFGGSFLNHQFLVSGRAPTWANWRQPDPVSSGQVHSMLDANGMPAATPLYANPKPGDAVLTQACPDQQNVPKEVRDAFVPGYACGDFAVNTVQPASQPFAPGTVDSKRLPAIDDKVFPNIGDELSARNVSWNWYSGGWDNAAGNVGGAGWTNGTTTGTCTDPDSKAAAVWPYCAGNLFQFHHQPLNYFANYAEHGPGRSHLQDEQNFLNDTRTGHLPAVSFVKPYGEENEHPGYASTTNGESHLVDLLKAIRSGPNAKDTLVVVTYDEFGGQWDHVPPPGQGPDAAEGPSDEWGPGTRIPALIIGGSFTRSGVDHQSHDTTSVLATIEHAFGLAPLTDRDAVVKDLGHALKVGHDRSGRAHRH